MAFNSSDNRTDGDVPESIASSTSIPLNSSPSSESTPSDAENAVTIPAPPGLGSSSQPKKITQADKEIFAAAKAGEFLRVRSLLSGYGMEELRILGTKYNVEGDTILHVAVRSEDNSIVELLLQSLRGIEHVLYDVLLLATKISSNVLVETILEAIISNPNLDYQKGKLSELPKWMYSEFDEHMTPMMLAAIVGSYSLLVFFSFYEEKLELKIAYDFRTKVAEEEISQNIIKPWSKFQFCPCVAQEFEEIGSIAKDRLMVHEYEAITSPVMLSFLANTMPNFDPLLATFKYIQVIQTIVKEEIELRESFIKILEGLKAYSVQFVALCKSSHELELLFTRKQGYHTGSERYPCLSTALHMGLLDFLAHPHSQAVLYNQWVGEDWPEWRYMSPWSKLQGIIFQVIFAPLYLLFLCGEQGNRFGRQLASPMNRCINYGISHGIFLALVIYRHLSTKAELRIPDNMYLELAIIIFVIGQTKTLVTQFYAAPRAFFKAAWNCYDLVTSLFFFACIFSWSYLYSTTSRKELVPFMNLRVPLERAYWPNTDPMLIADTILALGTILACGRMFRYIQLHEKVGPALIALRAMIKNVLHFMPFFFILLSAFCLGLTIIYRPYRNAISVVAEEDQSLVFTTYGSTLYELYWSLFGIVDVAADGIVHLSILINGTPSFNHHDISEYAGTFLHASYCFLGTTVLFGSILIAYISNTFMNILVERKPRWRFHRTKVWIYYSRASVMPPPLNLIPSLWNILHFFKMIRTVNRFPGSYALSCSCDHCVFLEPQDKAREHELNKEYYNLIKVLIQRYFRMQTSTKSSTSQQPCLEAEAFGEALDQLESVLNETVKRLTQGKKSKTETDPEDLELRLAMEETTTTEQQASHHHSSPKANVGSNPFVGITRASEVDISRLLTGSPTHRDVKATPKPITSTPFSPSESKPQSKQTPDAKSAKVNPNPKQVTHYSPELPKDAAKPIPTIEKPPPAPPPNIPAAVKPSMAPPLQESQHKERSKQRHSFPHDNKHAGRTATGATLSGAIQKRNSLKNPPLPPLPGFTPQSTAQSSRTNRNSR